MEPFPELTGYFCACIPSQEGHAIWSEGTLRAIHCTFVSTPGSTVSLSETSSATMINCTFTTSTSSAGDGEFEFIQPGGTKVDYGNCTGGQSPGKSGDIILVSNGNFTGCPLECPLGTYGPGGPTATLRELTTGCQVGCETCPAGAVCDAAGLPAPKLCLAGHYNPDRGSQHASGCRACERCA